MPPKRVIADSDEEEDFSPVRPASQNAIPDPRLDMEPLSPQHQPASTIARQHSILAVPDQDTSGSTTASFFAKIYDEQQSKALKQSHLIENIVRLSQKASASSGVVSSPVQGKGKGKKNSVNTSSAATDVTSPVLLTKAAPRKSQLAQMSDATEITTPRSAAKDEWDVPSSGDEAGASSNKGQQTTESATDESSRFYVAASNLSASQKRQFRRVQISDSHSSESAIPDSAGQMQPPSNHKSSGATTVAVSTPSRYASSGPRPPWETEQTTGVASRSAAVDLTMSSPDAIAVGDVTVPADDESPVRRPSVKRKRPSVRDDDDELGQDTIFEDPSSDLDPEFGDSSRRPAKRVKQPAKQPAKSPVDVPATEPKKRGRKKKQPVSEEIVHDEEVHSVPSIPVSAAIPEAPKPELDTPAEKPKKKRGRPRKSEMQNTDEATEVPASASEKPVAKKTAAPVSPGDTAVESGSTTIEDSWNQSAADISTAPEKNDSKSKPDENTTRSVSPLKETDRNTLLVSQSTNSESDKSVTKSITPSQAGKSLYRVGLSKKSRIAPLLKIIRK